MTVSEPMTLATDYLLALVVCYLGARLYKASRTDEQVAVRLWSLAFFASALAAASGGTFHGFALQLAPLVNLVLWKTTVYAVGLASLFLLCAGLFSLVSGRLLDWLLFACFGKFMIYAFWMTGHDDFKYVIYDYAPAMVLVLGIELYKLFGRRSPGAGWIIGGILVSFAAAGIQMSGLVFHRHFNHNDLYHLVQIGAFYLLYRGGVLLRDR